MSDKVFIDTNLWIYRFLTGKTAEDKRKRERVETLLLGNYDLVVSTQVLSEISSVLLRKYNLDSPKVTEHLKQIVRIASVHMLDEHTIFKALSVAGKYSFNFYDALIVSASLEAGCSVLYTEDLQTGQDIDNKLKIFNPFA